jgi:hypothetical protein
VIAGHAGGMARVRVTEPAVRLAEAPARFGASRTSVAHLVHAADAHEIAIGSVQLNDDGRFPLNALKSGSPRPFFTR